MSSEVNGKCPFPLGSNTLGLIYVNPEGEFCLPPYISFAARTISCTVIPKQHANISEFCSPSSGPMGEPDLAGAAATVRDVFGRMDWKGRELVALIGGGHTFGKAHGATTDSPGKPPKECPFASWAGATGMKAVTSGFEGPWTSEPTKWDNAYFRYLIDFDWEPIVGPGGHHQWRVKIGNATTASPKAPVADPNSTQTQDVMMLTTDVALVADPEYQEYVAEFAANDTALAETFAKAWYKLVTRDVGPAERCLGPRVPPPQHFQHPLPDPPETMADMDAVANDIWNMIEENQGTKVGRELVRLAFQCASTFRATDYQVKSAIRLD